MRVARAGKLFTLKQAAALLGVSVKTVIRHIAAAAITDTAGRR